MSNDDVYKIRDWVEIKSQRHDFPEQRIYACCNTLAMRRVTPCFDEDLIVEMDQDDAQWRGMILMALQEVKELLDER